jgi:hypothetical protein
MGKRCGVRYRCGRRLRAAAEHPRGIDLSQVTRPGRRPVCGAQNPPPAASATYHKALKILIFANHGVEFEPGLAARSIARRPSGRVATSPHRPSPAPNVRNYHSRSSDTTSCFG